MLSKYTLFDQLAKLRPEKVMDHYTLTEALSRAKSIRALADQILVTFAPLSGHFMFCLWIARKHVVSVCCHKFVILKIVSDF